MMPHAPSVVSGNALLDGLPPGELRALGAHLDEVRLERRHYYPTVGEPLSHVYFPLDGLVSLMVSELGGSCVQAASAGRDGMLGISVVLEVNDPPFEMLCLVAGRALRMRVRQFTDCARELPGFRRSLLRYTHAVFNEAVRTAACNGLHPIQQRLARCLLLTRDRLDAADFPLTHGALGQVLGATRALVTQTLNGLQELGVLEHERGLVRIIDSPGLERIACEDYAAIRMQYTAAEGHTPARHASRGEPARGRDP